MLSKIHFKSDEIQEFEEKTGLKVVPPEKWDEFHRWEQTQKNSASTNVESKKEFIPALSAADAPLKISNYSGKDQSMPFDISQTNRNDISKYAAESENNNVNESNRKETSVDEKYRSEEGKWGEKLVLRTLNEEFINNDNIEIIDLNEEGKTGVGADFVVKEKNSNAIIRLVEVKTTTQPKGSKVEISGRQWETARHNFKIDNGDIYWIYCVYNADKNNPEIVSIQNPIQKWKDGLLIADPVNFIILDN